jgi:hypothetical protein
MIINFKDAKNNWMSMLFIYMYVQMYATTVFLTTRHKL